MKPDQIVIERDVGDIVWDGTGPIVSLSSAIDTVEVGNGKILMAAYIGKKRAVARVVLFSGPWDFEKSPPRLAPWLIDSGATPPARWFAEYHRREKTAGLIEAAYRALQIPRENIRIFDLDLPGDMKFKGDNPFHGSTIRVPAYAIDWEFLFGHSTPRPGAGNQ